MRIQGDSSSRGFAAAMEATSAQTAARLAELPTFDRQLSGDNVEEAAQRFEALFMSMLVKEMRKTLPQGPFGAGPGADTYEAWFDEHVGQSVAASGAMDLVGILRSGLPRPGSLLASPPPAADIDAPQNTPLL